jgi:PAS domain-containing protein
MAQSIPEMYGSLVFNDKVMRSKLPKDMYKALKKTIENGTHLELDVANSVAVAMKEWAKGRATCGAAAGYLARALMFRHKYAEAYVVLKDIIAGKYGHYELTADYGDNFRENTENNVESLFEVQFLDFGTGGTDEEWTPVNISSQATQGHAVESNYASQALGSWGDLAGAPWLYNLFRKENSTDGRLDPRLYWTLITYESEYSSYTGAKTAAYPNGDPRSNTIYQQDITATPLSNNAQGGISIAKFTNARNNIYSSITNGLHCGINLRLMRYSDVLLRAAECENELHGPTQIAIDYINIVHRRYKISQSSILTDEYGEIKLQIASEILQSNDSKEGERYLFDIFRSIADNASDMIWAKDMDSKYIFANKAICDNLLIAESTDEPVGKTDTFFAKREREKHKDNPNWHTFGEMCHNSDIPVLQSKKPIHIDEYGNVRGKFLFLEVHKAPLYDKEGNLIGTVGTARDVTKQKELEAELKKTIEFQKNANEFLRDQLKELREPRVVVRLNARA